MKVWELVEKVKFHISVNNQCNFTKFSAVIYCVMTFQIPQCQGGLSFKRVLASLDRYMCEICRCHPDLLVVDLGTNDLAGTDCTVPDVVNRALRFLALVDNEVHPKMILILSVVQRTCMGNRCDMSLSQFNHRVKSYNSRLAVCVRQFSNVRMIAQSRLNFRRYISGDGCHLTEEGQCRYARGLRQPVLQFLRLC